MKSATIKATYSLDPLTVNEVENMAKQWDVPKSEVIRRSVHAAAKRSDALAPERAMSQSEALDILRSEPRPSLEEVEARMKAVRDERLAH